MQKTYLFIMLGYPGSGKSHVSRWLTTHRHAVYLRTDALRLAMFGNDRPELYSTQNKTLVNNASQYAITQILAAKQINVVHDANHNARSVRRQLAALAADHGATAVVVWVKTPLQLAKQRAEERKATEGHELFEPNLVEKMAKRLQEPGPDELVIAIDGRLSADDQQKAFDERFAALLQQQK